MTYIRPFAPVVALDVDGVLGQYHAHFSWFAELYTQRQLGMAFTPEMRGEFSEALGLDKKLYREVKLAYVHGGIKRFMPMFPGAALLCKSVHRAGAQLWLCATTPWLQTNPVDHDLLFWLENNGIEFDGLLFGDSKYRQLADIVGVDRIACAVDDLPHLVAEAEELGINAALRSQPHNAWCKEHLRLSNRVTLQEFVDKSLKEKQ